MYFAVVYFEFYIMHLNFVSCHELLQSHLPSLPEGSAWGTCIRGDLMKVESVTTIHINFASRGWWWHYDEDTDDDDGFYNADMNDEPVYNNIVIWC